MQNNTQTQEVFNLSTSQNITEETHRGDYLASDRQLEGTPFVIRWRADRGYFLTIGDTRLTEPTKTEKETLDRLHKEMYSMIAGMIVHIVKLLKKDDIVTEQKIEPITGGL